jgi:hypothetical protein
MIKVSYDRILDAVGNGGSENAFGPLNLANAGEMSLITTRPIPPGEAMSFDHCLNGIGFLFDTTVEPNPRPRELDSKFNPMVVNGAMGYIRVPDGFRIDTAVTWQMIPYEDRQGAYTRPLIPGVKINDVMSLQSCARRRPEFSRALLAPGIHADHDQASLRRRLVH